MSEASPELKVVSSNSRGRKRYDKASKRALVEACLRPGISIAGQALESGVHVSLLRKWIAQYLLERERTMSDQAPVVGQAADFPDPPGDPVQQMQTRTMTENRPSAFVAVESSEATSVDPTSACMAVALHVRLPNGVELDLSQADLAGLTMIVQMLGRMPCSGSTAG
ncbi:transposase [Cupriavidus sp. BIC8F]|uniref:transposase n=1 Tax=Cupriavidus sp. BIC8F TaxID=3079014 RepID=UPI002915E43A|nr:transposase [Cupriavidus sp. BIC8F]